MVLTVVCRDMAHDNPDLVERPLRSWLEGTETVAMLTLATLCSRGTGTGTPNGPTAHAARPVPA